MSKIILIVFLLLSFSHLFAQENPKQPSSANSSPMGMSQEELEKRISKKYSIPQRKITEYEESGIRLRDLMAAAAISKASKKSLDSLFLLKNNFTSWEEVAKSLKVAPDIIFKDMEDIKNGHLKSASKSKKSNKPKAAK
jgi:glutamyl/glutaminyl-tRNA synthetase